MSFPRRTRKLQPDPTSRSIGSPEEVELAALRQRVETFVASRNRGDAITGRVLEAGISVPSISGVAEALAVQADATLASITEKYRPALDCKDGCAYCCRKPGVLISLPELFRILRHVKSTFQDRELSELASRARAYVEHLGGRSFNDPVNESFPCPLLVDERCSVYDIRPLVCRGYNSTSVDACREAHANSESLVPMFALLKDSTDGATVGASQRLETAGQNGSMLDLGTSLDIALQAGDGFEEAVLSGGPGLSPAENRWWTGRLWDRVTETARQLKDQW